MTPSDIPSMRDETLGLLRRFRVSLDPSLDEQQLVDPGVLERLISYAGVSPEDTVLEVGAGCGNITVALAKAAGRVIAVEKSGKFLPILEERTAGLGNVEIVQGDALSMRLPEFDKLVSNLPYRICEAMVQRLTHLEFGAAALIVSSSFARILAAEPGDPNYSRLSLVAGSFFSVERLEEVAPGAYFPEPGKPTSIVRLEPGSAPGLGGSVLRGVLLQEGKKLGNALREALISSHLYGGPSTKREARAEIRSMRLPPGTLERRVARLSLEEIEFLVSRLEAPEQNVGRGPGRA